MRFEFKAGLADLRTELKTDIAALRTDLKSEIGAVARDLSELKDTMKGVGIALATAVPVVTAFAVLGVNLLSRHLLGQ